MSEANPTKEESLHLLVVRRTYELLTAAFSLVAALAWNDAIQALFLQVFGPAQTLLAKFAYAVILTVLIVWLGSRFAKMSAVVEKHLTK
jgi:membrane protein YdbS with pleckstrin-like domain